MMSNALSTETPIYFREGAGAELESPFAWSISIKDLSENTLTVMSCSFMVMR